MIDVPQMNPSFFFLLLSFFAHVVDSLVLSTAIFVLYLINQNYFGAGLVTLSSHHHNNQKKQEIRAW